MIIVIIVDMGVKGIVKVLKGSGEYMSEKRFFILTDDEYNTRPFIRDRKKEIHDIYGDYKYDDLNEICNTLNKLFDSNNSLKESLLLHLDIIDGLNDKIKELKQQIEDLEFNLRTIEAYDRTVKEEHSDTVYDFRKKLEKW